MRERSVYVRDDISGAVVLPKLGYSLITIHDYITFLGYRGPIFKLMRMR